MPAAISAQELAAFVGRELGVSDWREVTQDQVDRFADVTDDDQFIHVDPARAAAETPFGGTVAHGFLTLSLLSSFGREALPAIRDRAIGINYGLERVRFLSPVRVGSRLRGRFGLLALTMRRERELQMRYAVTIELEGSDRPALAAEWLTLAILR